jgi:hypothetical protein
MSFLDSVLANTVGVGYRAVTGNVDPWTLANMHEDLNDGIKQALGPDATDAEIAAAQSSAVNQQDSYLKSIDAHPSQAGIRVPGLGVIGTPEFLARVEKIVYGLIAAGAVLGVFYFSQRYGSTLKKTFRKR